MQQPTSAGALTFHETTFDLVDNRTGSPWLRMGQIAPALGYSDVRSLNQLYASNSDEFTDAMTSVVKAPTAGGMQDLRIFSLRGAHLLGMFARTERAKEFRRWVLDVLEHRGAALPVEQLEIVDLPAPAPLLPATIAATLARVTAERDILRRLLGKRLLKENPIYHKVLKYLKIEVLSDAERAKLMGWKSTRRLFEIRHELAAAGLIDWTPDPMRSANGKLQVQRIQAMHTAGLIQLGTGPGATAAGMAKARQARSDKLAAIAAASQEGKQ